MIKLFYFSLFLLMQPVLVSAQQWDDVGGGVNSSVNDMYADTVNNRLYVCGNFKSIGNLTNVAVAYWDGASWTKVCNRNPKMGQLSSIVLHKGELILTGEFSEIEGKPAKNVARYRNGAWEAFGSPNSTVKALTFEDELYITGLFDTIDGKAINKLAKWTDSTWVKPFANDSLFKSTAFTSLNDIVRYQGKIIIGGNFQDYGLSCLAAFDGINWTPLQYGLPPGGLTDMYEPEVHKLQVYKDILYIGGSFTGGGGLYSNLRAWDGMQFFNPFPGLWYCKQVTDLQVFKGEIYISGLHMLPSNELIFLLAKFDGEKFASFGGPAGFSSSLIDKLRFVSDKLYVSCGYDIFLDQVNYLAQWMGKFEQPLLIMPNPGLDQVKIIWTSLTASKEKLYIRNSYGQIVKEFWIPTHFGINEITVDISALNSGVYFFSLGIYSICKFVKL